MTRPRGNAGQTSCHTYKVLLFAHQYLLCRQRKPIFLLSKLLTMSFIQNTFFKTTVGGDVDKRDDAAYIAHLRANPSPSLLARKQELHQQALRFAKETNGISPEAKYLIGTGARRAKELDALGSSRGYLLRSILLASCITTVALSLTIGFVLDDHVYLSRAIPTHTRSAAITFGLWSYAHLSASLVWHFARTRVFAAAVSAFYYFIVYFLVSGGHEIVKQSWFTITGAVIFCLVLLISGSGQTAYFTIKRRILRKAAPYRLNLTAEQDAEARRIYLGIAGVYAEARSVRKDFELDNGRFRLSDPLLVQVQLSEKGELQIGMGLRLCLTPDQEIDNAFPASTGNLSRVGKTVPVIITLTFGFINIFALIHDTLALAESGGWAVWALTLQIEALIDRNMTVDGANNLFSVIASGTLPSTILVSLVKAFYPNWLNPVGQFIPVLLVLWVVVVTVSHKFSPWTTAAFNAVAACVRRRPAAAVEVQDVEL
jgi:hypothetical protein